MTIKQYQGILRNAVIVALKMIGTGKYKSPEVHDHVQAYLGINGINLPAYRARRDAKILARYAEELYFKKPSMVKVPEWVHPQYQG